MDAFVISEKDMAGKEEQAAAEAMLLLSKGEKVIFILAGEIPGLQLDGLCRRIGADRSGLSGRASELMSFASQVSKSSSICSGLLKAGFSCSFMHGFYVKGRFPEKISSLDFFINREYLEQEASRHSLLIIAPLSVPEDALSGTSAVTGIEGTGVFDSLEISSEQSQMEIKFAENPDVNSGLLAKSVFDIMKARNISLDMINMTYDSVLFICPDKLSETASMALREAGIVFSCMSGVSKFSFAGTGIKGASGIMDSILASFDKRKISVLRTTDSHTTISCLISSSDSDKALEASLELGISEDRIIRV